MLALVIVVMESLLVAYLVLQIVKEWMRTFLSFYDNDHDGWVSETSLQLNLITLKKTLDNEV